MKTLRLAIFALVALAQLAVPASMIWKRQMTLREGRVWKFRTQPVDPVDAVRGRYLSLRFEAEGFSNSASIDSRPVYLSVKEDADGFAVVDQISATPLRGDNVFKSGRVWGGTQKHADFPFNKMWLNEKDARAADAIYAAENRRSKADSYAIVRIKNGDAAIEDLFLGGKPLRDWLHAKPAP